MNGNEEETEEPKFVRDCERAIEKIEASQQQRSIATLFADDAIEALDSAASNYVREARAFVEEEHKQRVSVALKKACEAHERARAQLVSALVEFEEACSREA